MASAAFFFISNRFNEINVGRCLDKLVSSLEPNVEFVLRCDLDDIRSCPVDGCLIGRDVDTWIDNLGRRRDRTEMSFCDACGELGVGDERVSLSYKNAHVKRLLFLHAKVKPQTCRHLLEPIHGVPIECFEHAYVFLLKRAFYKGPMCEQLVGEMAVEKDAFSGERPQEGYACRKLVHKEDVVFECGGTKEELGEREMELPCVCKENVEFAVPCPQQR